jgi:hypothetical protein
MRNYWEHVGEHIENLGNMLETHWEHIGNPKKITNSPQKKKGPILKKSQS